jgi:hypothetical protein
MLFPSIRLLIRMMSPISFLASRAAAATPPEPPRPPAAPVNAAQQPPSATVAAATPARGPRPAGSFRAGTFNAGLAVGVLAHAEARVALVVQALVEEPLDLLCVKEFWLEEHWQRLVSAAAERLPCTHRLAADPGDRCDQRDRSAVRRGRARSAGSHSDAATPTHVASSSFTRDHAGDGLHS